MAAELMPVLQESTAALERHPVSQEPRSHMQAAAPVVLVAQEPVVEEPLAAAPVVLQLEAAAADNKLAEVQAAAQAAAELSSY